MSKNIPLTNSKVFVLFLLFSFSVIGTFIAVDAIVFSKLSHKVALQSAITKTEDKEKLFNNFTDKSSLILRTIKNSMVFREYKDGKRAKSDAISLFFNLTQTNQNFMQLRYLDINGQEQIRIDRDAEFDKPFIVSEDRLQNKAKRYYFYDSITKPLGKVWYSNLDLNIENGKIETPFKPTLRAMLPLEKDGKFDGILIINYFMKDFLKTIVNDTAFNLILTNKSGDILVSYDESLNWKDININSQIPITEKNIFEKELFYNDMFLSRKLKLEIGNTLFLFAKIGKNYIQTLQSQNYNQYILVSLLVMFIFIVASFVISKVINKLGVDLDNTKRLEQFFRGSFEQASVGIAHMGLDGHWLRVNEKLCEMLGYTNEQMHELTCMDITYEDDKAETKKGLENLKNKKIDFFRTTKRCVRKDKKLLWIDTSMSLVLNDDGVPEYITAIILDVTKQLENEAKLRQSNMVFENTIEGVVITDIDANILSINDAFSKITGYDKKEVLGKNMSILKSGRHDKIFYEKMWHDIKTENKWQGEIFNRRENGEIYPQWINISAVTDKDGKVENYISVFSDITELKESEEKLYYVQHFDQITGLPNRKLLKARLENTIELATKHHNKIAVMYIDLDNFKHINDSFGMSVGDDIIVDAGRRLHGIIRAQDVLASVGGDEFILVMSEIKSIDAVIEKAKNILKVFEKPFSIEDKSFVITASIGISIAPDDSKSAVTLMSNADAAMFEAKKTSKGSFAFYDKSITALSFEKILFENAIKSSVKNDELELYFQPQINLNTDKCIAFEALLRWNHPELGLVMPDRFISIAEDIKAIIPIGEHVIKLASDTLENWNNENVFGGKMAINVSGVQLENTDIYQIIKGYIDSHHLAPSRIEVEVTESTIMRNPIKWINILKKIRESGVTISIDDFGTGYSSLNYLRKLPIDVLKIDRSFILDLPFEKDACAVVDAIISMAKSLGITVLAEGVETKEQLDYLKSRKCDIVQGYYFAKPMKKLDAKEWLCDFHSRGKK